ncbi:hypothetical protein CDD80_7110 [Ophiocordyceps camponoti-rufipedis]|uniref:Polyprenal reductase n=1 Tax=Ophiocordyceps camponoti-rufipedis TaxID=2004952 RepID=A0A2C5YMM6_9HYPO|nr:hypothetical protein CDD80_7110 [Ophiocordyceps camponoti-rufipedis]
MTTTPSPSLCCQTIFLAISAALLAAHLLPPPLRHRLLQYGARGAEPLAGHDAPKLLSSIVNLQVPHAWFWHFYLGSFIWSLVWAWQYRGRGALMGGLARAQLASSDASSVDLGRVYLAWAMMAAQGSRRLLECLFVMRPGKSSMSWAHWLMGLGHYALVNLSIWIHGSDGILESWTGSQPVVLLTLRNSLGLAVYLAAWLEQNRCHRHLASLPKYTLPSEGLFRLFVCPHYTCECVIYLALAFVAAPPDRLFNPSLLCIFVFVVTNLGTTARNTEKWYGQKFGRDKLAGRWKMIPFVF